MRIVCKEYCLPGSREIFTKERNVTLEKLCSKGLLRGE